MDPLQILERYFNTFITQDDPKHFFIGMADYLNYGDALPEYDWITTQISAMPQAQIKKLEEQDKVAMEKVKVLHDEIASYIKKKKIDIPAVDNALRECQQVFDGHVHGSNPMPYMVHLRLYDIVQALYPLPEHKEFASSCIVFSERDKTQPVQYLPVKELDELMETKKELERGADDAIWGIQAHIYHLRDVVNKGREIGKGISERIKNRELGATWDMMNFGVVMGEWVKIEDGRPERDPVFFVPKKVRPQVQRFHMHVLANWPRAQAALTQAAPKTDALSFDLNTGRLRMKGVEIKTPRTSDQYDLLRVIFEKKGEIGKEWFFHEVALAVDEYQDGKQFIKKYYNAAYQLNRKLAAKGVKDFFILNTDSVKITPHHLS